MTNYPTSLDSYTGADPFGFGAVGNNVYTALAVALTAGATTVQVDDASRFQSRGYVSIDNEVISHTGKTATTLTGCTRGADGTTAAAHAIDAEVAEVPTAAHHDVLARAIVAVETKLGTMEDTAAVNQYLTGTGAGASAWVSGLEVNVMNPTYGATGDGTTNDLPAFDAARDALGALGGTILAPVPPVAYKFGSPFIIGNGTTTTASTYHGIHLMGGGCGVGGAISGNPTNVGTLIKASATFDTSLPLIKIQGPIHNVSLTGLQLDCNARAAYGVQTLHGYRFRYTDVVVRGWRDIAWDFNTQTGVTAFSIGCGEGTLDFCGSHEPALTTAHAMKFDGNDTTILDTCRVHVKGGDYFYGSDASARGAWFRFADNNYFDGVMLMAADGGTGVQIYFEPAGNPIYPSGNKFVNATMIAIGGTSGTGGNLFLGWLLDVPTPHVPYCYILTEKGTTVGFREDATYAARSPVTHSNDSATYSYFTDTMTAGSGNAAGTDIVLRTTGYLKSNGGACTYTLRHRLNGSNVCSIVQAALAAGTYPFELETVLRVETVDSGAGAALMVISNKLLVDGQAVQNDKALARIVTASITGVALRNAWTTESRHTMSTAVSANDEISALFSARCVPVTRTS
jgi:hypothetical protein